MSCDAYAAPRLTHELAHDGRPADGAHDVERLEGTVGVWTYVQTVLPMWLAAAEALRSRRQQADRDVLSLLQRLAEGPAVDARRLAADAVAALHHELDACEAGEQALAAALDVLPLLTTIAAKPVGFTEDESHVEPATHPMEDTHD